MRRIFAIIICAALALTLAACSCNGASGGKGKTVISQIQDSSEIENIKSGKAIIHGRVSGNAAPEGWALRTDEGGDYITYIQMTEAYETAPDECPYVQIGCDDLSAEDLLNSVITLKDAKGETYATDSVTIGENLFLGIFCDSGENSLFGSVNGSTMIINYKGVDIDDETVQSIIGGIEIAPEN